MNANTIPGKWIVSLKGDHSQKSFEISVVRANNEHGIHSYGWFGKDKLLITHNGGPCDWPLTPRIWKLQVDLAKTVAQELNQEEFNVTEEAKVIRKFPLNLD